MPRHDDIDAIARPTVMDQEPTARAPLLLIREGQLTAAADDPAFEELLDRVAQDDGDLDLAVELHNGHQWATDPVSPQRNVLDAAVPTSRHASLWTGRPP